MEKDSWCLSAFWKGVVRRDVGQNVGLAPTCVGRFKTPP